jgi:Na+/melibiose symporter-like transporter
MASTAFGLNALITKPAQSFAPMITVAILNFYGYSSITRKTGASDGQDWNYGYNGTFTTNPYGNVTHPTVTPSNPEVLTNAMFLMTCVVTISIGVVQLILWRFYKIRATHENNIYEAKAEQL